MIKLTQADFEQEPSPVVKLTAADFENSAPPVSDRRERDSLTATRTVADRMRQNADMLEAEQERKREQDRIAALQADIDMGRPVDPELLARYQDKLTLPKPQKPKAVTGQPGDTQPAQRRDEGIQTVVPAGPTGGKLVQVGGTGIGIPETEIATVTAALDDAALPAEQKMLRVLRALKATPESKSANAAYIDRLQDFLVNVASQGLDMQDATVAAQRAKDTEDFLRPIYLAVKGYGGGLTLGASDIVLNKLERRMGGAVDAQSLDENFLSGVSRLAGGIRSGRGIAGGLGGALGRTGLGTTAQMITTRLGTALASTVGNQITGLLAGTVKPDEMAGNIGQNVGAAIASMIPEFGLPRGVGNFAGQVVTDFVYDLGTDLARGRVKPGENFTEWLLQTELPQLANSIIFATMDYTDKDFERNRQRVKADLRRAFDRDFLKQKLGMGQPPVRATEVRALGDTMPADRLLPEDTVDAALQEIRARPAPAPAPVEVDAAPVPTMIQLPAAADTAAREAEVARQNAAAGIARELPPQEPAPAPPAKPAEPVPQPAAPQRVEPAYPLSTAPAGAPHPFIDSQGRYVDAERNVVVRDGEPVQAPPERLAVEPVDSRVEPAGETQAPKALTGETQAGKAPAAPAETPAAKPPAPTPEPVAKPGEPVASVSEGRVTKDGTQIPDDVDPGVYRNGWELALMGRSDTKLSGSQSPLVRQSFRRGQQDAIAWNMKRKTEPVAPVEKLKQKMASKSRASKAAQKQRIADARGVDYDIFQFVKDQGGVKAYDDGMMSEEIYGVGGKGGLQPSLRASQGRGMKPDEMAAAAVEAGLLPPGSIDTDLVAALRGRKTNAEILSSERQREIAAEGEMEQAAFKLKQDQKWKRTQAKLAKTGEQINSEKLSVGDEFTIDGERYRVVEEGETALKVEDGRVLWLPYETPRGKSEQIYIDRGSLKKAAAGGPEQGAPRGELFKEGDLTLVGQKVPDTEKIMAERAAAAERKAKLDSMAQEIPGVEKPAGPGLRGGPGAAAAEGEGEFAPRGTVRGREPEGSVTSIRNRQTDMEREQLGLPPAEPVLRRVFGKVLDDATKKLDDDPDAGRRLVSELKEKPRSLSDTEDAILLREQVQAQAEYNRAASAANKAAAANDTRALTEAEARLGVARDKLYDIYDVGRKAGTQNARAMNARKMFIDEDFNLVSMQMQKRAANDGKPLTPEQNAEIERIKAEYEKTKKALEDHLKEHEGDRLDFKGQKLRDAHEGVAKKWRDGIQRDKLNPDRWERAIDEWLKDKRAVVPDGVLKDAKEGLKRATRIPDKRQRDDAIARELSKILPFAPIKAGEWFDAYVYTNMLSGPMSHVRNTLGNLTNLALLRPLTLVARGELQGAKTFLKKSWGAAVDGSAWRAAMSAFRSGESGKMVESLPDLSEGATPIQKLKRQMDVAKRQRGPESKTGRKVWKTLNWVGQFMQAQDLFVGRMIEAGESERLVRSGETREMADERAAQLASQYLYRDKLQSPDRSLDPASKSLEHMGLVLDSLRRIPGPLGRAFKLAVPFLKTPVKIAQFNTQVTPLGFIGAMRDRIAKARYDKSYKQIQSELQAETLKNKPNVPKINELKGQIEDIEDTSWERRGKAAVGTVLTTLGAVAAWSGNTTWELPDDKNARALAYDAGYKPYSFRVGDKWVPMIYLGPGMIAFAIPAAIKHVLQDDPDGIDDAMMEKAYKLLAAVPVMLMDQLPLEGANNILGALTGRSDFTAKKIAGRTALQLVPASGALQFIRNLLDRKYRKPITIEDTIKAAIPGLSEYVKTIKDSRGLDAKMTLWDALVPYKIGVMNEKKAGEYDSRMRALREKMESKKKAAQNR